jgi:hypothetical protein
VKKQTEKDRRDERRGEKRYEAHKAKDRKDERRGEDKYLRRERKDRADERAGERRYVRSRDGRSDGDPRKGMNKGTPSSLKFSPDPLKAGGSYMWHQPGDLETPKGPSLRGHRVPRPEPVADSIDAHQGQEPN